MISSVGLLNSGLTDNYASGMVEVPGASAPQLGARHLWKTNHQFTNLSNGLRRSCEGDVVIE